MEKQLITLDTMKTRALEIRKSLEDKREEEYLREHDRYYDMMQERIKKAIQYLKKTDASSLTHINDLRNLVQIAEITHNEQKTVDILKNIFIRFPETKIDKRLLKVYFPNAYLVEPEEIETYVDITIFTHNEQLEIYYALALGFSELDNAEKAKEYIKKGDDLLEQLRSEGVQRNTIPVLRLAGLRSFIEYKLGNTSGAYEIIDDAKKELTDEYSIKELELLENRLKILGQKAESIEYQFQIGTKDPVDFSTLKGSVILLYFFTWNCEPCTIYLPFLFALEKEIKNSNFKIVGVTQYTGNYESYQDISEIREYKYLKDHYYIKRKITWPVNITRNDWMDTYGISTYPAYILIDKEGIVQDGYYISNFSYLKKKIEILLAK